MSIDCYLSWDGMCEYECIERLDPNFKFKTTKPYYLYEKIDNLEYSTIYRLFTECWISDNIYKGTFENGYYGVEYDYNLIKERLSVALSIYRTQSKKYYNEFDEYELWQEQKFIVDFVELMKEKEKETGKPCRIYVSYN